MTRASAWLAHRAWLLVLIFVALSAPDSITPAGAITRAILTGAVYDLATGAPIPGAAVAVGARMAATDSGGNLSLELPHGSYRVRISAPGFVAASLPAVLVGPDAPHVAVGLPPEDPDADVLVAMARRVVADIAAERAAGPAQGVDTLAVTEVPRVIRVLMPDGEIVPMDTDEYLRGVVPAEIGFLARRSMAVLKAQAVAARTYASMACLRGSAGDPNVCEPGLDANVDTTTRTQVWRPVHYDVSDAAVRATHGQAIMQAGRMVQTLYFARTVERTLDSEASRCCGGRTWPHLRGVASPEAFGALWGHGAGMSQEGAATLADWGASMEDILAHYYSGATVSPPGVPRLWDPVVEPREVAAGGVVEVSVSYADPDGDPPVAPVIRIGESTFPLAVESGDARTGIRLAASIEPAPGNHAVVFKAEDGYLPPVTLTAGTLRVHSGNTAAQTPAPVHATAAGLRYAVRRVGPADLRQDIPGDTASAAPLQANPTSLVSGVADAGMAFMAVGVRRLAPDAAPSVEILIRASRDGETWTPWLPLHWDEAEAPEHDDAIGQWTQLGLLRGDLLQVRVESPLDRVEPLAVGQMEVYVIDADAGPAAPRRAAQNGPAVINRAGWGADESLRFDPEGNETWPPFYTRPRAQVVHHTVTGNEPSDPAAVVRAIYHYHAVSRGWGDIGYNFLVDHRGNVYEGRFGGERNDTIVQGGHAIQYNTNTIGVALMGTFTEARPAAAAEAGLVELLAAKGIRYGLEPEQPVELAGNPFPKRILGHRDVLPGHTVCPGDVLHGRLAGLRLRVTARMEELRGAGPGPQPPAATATAPPRPPTSTPEGSRGECREAIRGGDFEAVDPSWALNRAYYTTWDAYLGQSAMFVGLRATDPDIAESWASAAQTVQIPAGTVGGRLTFAAKGVGAADDRRLVRLMDAGGAVRALGQVAIPADDQWRVYSFDVSAAVSAMAGGEARVYFGVVNNGDGQRSHMRLDEVSLELCGSGSEPRSTDPLPTEPPPAATTAAPATSTPLLPSPTPRPSATPEVVCADLLGPGAAAGRPMWRSVGSFPLDLSGSQFTLGPPAHGGFGFAAALVPIGVPGELTTAALELRIARQGADGAGVVELRNIQSGTRRYLIGPDPDSVAPGGAEFRFPLTRTDLAPGSQIYVAALAPSSAAAPLRWTVVEARLPACWVNMDKAWLPRAGAERR